MNKSSVTIGLVLAVVLLGALYAAAYLFPREHAPAAAPRVPMSAITPQFMGDVAYGPWRLNCSMIAPSETVAARGAAPEPTTPPDEPAPPASAPAPELGDLTPDLSLDMTPAPAPAAGAASPTPAAPVTPAEPVRVCRVMHAITSGGEKPRLIALVNILIQKTAGTQKPVLVMLLPPQSKGDAGLILWVDDKEKAKVEIGACNEKQCMVRAAIPDQLLRQMLEGKTLSLALPLPDNKRAKLDVPLQGFKPAWEALGRAS